MRYDDKRLSYMGRIDINDDGAAFYWPSSQVTAVFKGTYADITVMNRTAYGIITIGYIIDGRKGRIPFSQADDGQFRKIRIVSDLDPEKEHTLTIFKRQAANHAFTISDIDCDGEFLPCEPEYRLKLEFYGDSVSAGECTEADDFAGSCDPCNHMWIYDNSYTWQCARLLGASFHNTSQGGIAVFDDTGYFHWPKMIGMESVYDKVCYFPEGGEITKWDFGRYIPDVVVFALGQNDKHNGITDADDIDIYDPAVRRRWKDGYIKLIRDVTVHYGDVKIVMITTVLMHDPEWDAAIDEIVTELRGQGYDIHHFLFTGNGAVTPGHPRTSEHAVMAKELAAFIGSLTGIES